MTDSIREIDSALSSREPIAKDRVLSWLEPVHDLPGMAMLYRLTGEHYYRIQPELGKAASCTAVRNYLLECIRQDLQNGEFQSRWEASQTLHLWLRQLLEMKDSSDEIEKTAHAITDLFLQSGEEIRAAIEQGFLEHALESTGLRSYFDDWSKNEHLREAWLAATAWADDHLDWSWNLHQEFLAKTRGL